MQLTITGYSTALFATWYFVDELGLLLDAGEGLTAYLLQKSRKVSHVFISHADRDHLAGLLQFNQLNAREGLPIIHYPKDSGSFPALEQFTKRFDPHVAGTVWKPVMEGDRIVVKDDIVVEPVRNGHVPVVAGITKSLSYKVVQVKSKLRPEFTSLPGEEIRKIIQERGKEQTTMEVRTTLLGYSADTPVEDLERWNHCKTLIHEATFLGGPEDSRIQTHGNKHSSLEEVMEMVSGLQIEQLILGHFSARYSPEQIDQKILSLCEKHAISIPVHRLLPGETVKDILKQKPVNR
ncbi:RNAse Z [Pseudoflavitalea sp. X16]|uniref:MBL fold metallo-hydrolase n=1 Tax=Paraflavitalea devenefica TaxID=2716334 RepID=UPI00141D9F6F|nr:MBL fold metallo-hydrolase [Paraflavitalea devenefica]NII26609.1 RNAse Z [Paraflavitalea devenefica]